MWVSVSSPWYLVVHIKIGGIAASTSQTEIDGIACSF